MKMKVYDLVTDSWETINGPELLEQICRPFSVNYYGNIVYVVGRNLHLVVGNIWKSENKFGVRWEVVDSPERYVNITPSNSQVLFA
ncbi:unnamed protein product [Arabis nemorensis]|uniref:F-box associated domain-containing protein n=1 Tax=Arabis nemorensis TaxID=586526 RepID=A0A565AUG0_9BRAS|nr:unnamed protein product [Arabis nemorensis]